MSSVQEWICAKVLSNSKDEFKTFFISMSSRSRPDSCARFMLISEEGPRGFKSSLRINLFAEIFYRSRKLSRAINAGRVLPQTT